MTTTITHLMNRFTSLTRTVNPDGSHTLDAIDDQGRAWWLIVGNDEAPGSWTELLPLPQATVDKPISPLAGALVERVGVALAIADVENVAWNRELGYPWAQGAERGVDWKDVPTVDLDKDSQP